LNNNNTVSHTFPPQELIQSMGFLKAMCNDEGRALLDDATKVLIKERYNRIVVQGHDSMMKLNVLFGNINKEDRIFLAFFPDASRNEHFLDGWEEVESYASFLEHKFHKKLAQPFCLRPGSKQWCRRVGAVLCVYSQPKDPNGVGVLVEAHLA
jgi:hypothetical protein